MTPTDSPQRRHGLIGLGRALARWDPYLGAQLVVASAIVLDVSLPKKLTIGPVWVLPAFEALLLVGLVVTAQHPQVRKSQVRSNVAMGLIGLVSAVNIVSLVLLCHELLKGGLRTAALNGGRSIGHELILAGAVLWVTNVLLFGLWYWQLDRGGPIARTSEQPQEPDFLFPQMTEQKLAVGWMPNLIDYLYVSFTNATAFSPTDAMPLTRMAKLLMAIQALAALVTIGLVVARAVNILA